MNSDSAQPALGARAVNARGLRPIPPRPLGVAHSIGRLTPYLLIACLPIAMTAPWLKVPWDRDEAAYATLAIGMRHGLVPYRDLFDHKPPLIYVVYWIAFLPGVDMLTPRLLAAAALGATALVVVGVARAFGLRRLPALAAGFIFALSTSNVQGQLDTNIEAFMVLPMTASLAALLRDENRLRWCVTAGCLSGLAVLFKTTAALPAGALVVYLVARRTPNVRGAAAFLVGGLLPVALSALAFVALSAGTAFWYANVTYNRLYIGAAPVSQRLRGIASFNIGVALGSVWLWALALVGLAVLARYRNRRGCLLILWAGGCYAGIISSGRQYPHYYMQLAPAAAISGAIGIQWMAEHWRDRRLRFSAYAAFVPLVAFEILLYAALVRAPTQRAKSHALTDAEAQCEALAPGIGSWIADHSTANDTIYNLGRDTEIYVYSGRLPAARFMYDRPFALDSSTVTQTAEALRRAHPRYIIDTLGCTPNSNQPSALASVLTESYRFVALINGASIYELR